MSTVPAPSPPTADCLSCTLPLPAGVVLPSGVSALVRGGLPPQALTKLS